MGDEFEGAQPAVAMFLRMALANMHKRDPQASRQELIARLAESAERALEDINHASDHPGYADPCVSCEEVSSSEKTQEPASTCRSAQQKVQEEVERIKNAYDHNINKRGRGHSFFSEPLQTELGKNFLMPEQYRQLNHAISAAYGELARDAPDLPWVPVGHVVASQFGCNMRAMQAAATVFEARDSPFSFTASGAGVVMANNLDDAVRAIGEGCLLIFEHMYPTMRLVADIGIDQFLECAENEQFNPPLPDKLVKAIKELKEGNFKRAEYLIVDYEQRDVAPKIYQDFAKQYEFMQTMAEMSKAGTFGTIDPQSVLPLTQCAMMPGFSLDGIEPIRLDGSIFNEDNRVNFYHKLKPAILQHYRR